MRVIEFHLLFFRVFIHWSLKQQLFFIVGVKSCSLTIFQLSEKIQTKCVEVANYYRIIMNELNNMNGIHRLDKVT